MSAVRGSRQAEAASRPFRADSEPRSYASSLSFISYSSSSCSHTISRAIRPLMDHRQCRYSYGSVVGRGVRCVGYIDVLRHQGLRPRSPIGKLYIICCHCNRYCMFFIELYLLYIWNDLLNRGQGSMEESGLRCTLL